MDQTRRVRTQFNVEPVFARGSFYRSLILLLLLLLCLNVAVLSLIETALAAEDLEWGDQEWFPRVAKLGWRYWAIVMPEKIIGHPLRVPVK